MRKFLKKSGITSVVLVSLAAMAFLPKSVSQWIILAAVVFFVALKCAVYYSEHRDEFLVKREFLKSGNKKSTKSKAEQMLNYVVIQLSHRITDKLHSAFPESSWHWIDRPTVNLFAEGGRLRIATKMTDDFNGADVILDSFGRIGLEMLKTDTFTKIIKDKDNNADTDYTVDAEAWYSQCGQKALTDIITDLNARGTKVLSINEDGSIVINDGEQIGVLKSFPSKNVWKKLIEIFEKNDLKAVEDEHSILLGW